MPKGPTLSTLVGTTSTSQTAAGTTTTDANLVVADHVHVESLTSNAGVRLKPGVTGEWGTVCNATASGDLKLYPPTGASFNGAAANTAITIASNKSAFFVFVDSNSITAIY